VRPGVRGLAPLEWLSTVTTRLVQSPAIGYDGVANVLPPGHTVANAAGVHEDSTAEQAMTLILAAQRDLPYYVRAADQGRWGTRTSPGLSGRTVLLLGVGGVGRAVEARLRPFGPEIVRVAHTAREGVHGVSELPTLLPDADVVVVAVRLDDSTVRLVGAGFLARMRDGAPLVNVARGAVVDTTRWWPRRRAVGCARPSTSPTRNRCRRTTRSGAYRASSSPRTRPGRPRTRHRGWPVWSGHRWTGCEPASLRSTSSSGSEDRPPGIG
jgi:hypothetical protein